MLKSAGFPESKFYHVFPDYKLPSTIIRENQAMYDLGISGFIRGLFEDRTGSREYFFHDILFLHTLFKARLLHQFSNSFLIVCSKGQSKNLETRWLAKKFWNDEGINPILHHTISLVDDGSEYSIHRRPMHSGVFQAKLGDVGYHISPKAAYISGKSVLIEAYKSSLMQSGRENLLRLVKQIFTNLLSMNTAGSFDSSGYPLVPGDKIDFCFWNLIKTAEGKFEFVDNKWKLSRDIPADFIIFRNLLYLFRDVYPFIQEKAFSEFSLPIMQSLFPSYSLDRFEENLIRESEFQSSIRLNPVHITDVIYSDADKSNLIGFSNMRNMLDQKESYILQLQSGRGWKLLNSYYTFKQKACEWIKRF
jgi:hypothetical protein